MCSRETSPQHKDQQDHCSLDRHLAEVIFPVLFFPASLWDLLLILFSTSGTVVVIAVQGVSLTASPFLLGSP